LVKHQWKYLNLLRNEDKDEINLVEWLRMVKEYGMTPLRESIKFNGEYWLWWKSVNNRQNITWEVFEELFSKKWIKDLKLEAMHKIEKELEEEKEDIKKKGDELSKIQDLNEAQQG
jgi:hypothetical protein